METKLMDIDKLIPAEYNPRVDLQRGDEEYEKLKAVISQFGFVQPIVYNERTNVVVGGHQRLKVAKDLGYSQVPTVMVDLDDKDERILNLALNKVGGMFDEEKLGNLLAELQGMDTDLDLTGFNSLEIEELTLAFGDSSGEFNIDDYSSSNGNDEYDPFDEDGLPENVGLETQSGDGESRISNHKIIFGKYKAIMTEEEFDKLVKKYKQYSEMNRNDYGFVGWLLEGAVEQ
jgi:hypothetical protein